MKVVISEEPKKPIIFTKEKYKYEGEYRIPDRDNHKNSKLTLTKGTQVLFDKQVIRVGYPIWTGTFTKQEWYEAGVEILVKRTKLPIETVELVLSKLDLYSPFKSPTMKSLIYSQLVSAKKWELTKEQEGSDYPFSISSDLEYRSMWFKDFTDPIHGVVVGRLRRWTGKYFSPIRFEGSYYEPPEYEPGGLYPAYNQNLYWVAPYYKVVDGIDTKHCMMIYPDDIKVEE